MNSSLPSASKRTFKMVSIVLEVDSKMPTIRGQWLRLPNGRIKAWYTPEEYEKCLELFAGLAELRNTESARQDQAPI